MRMILIAIALVLVGSAAQAQVDTNSSYEDQAGYEDDAGDEMSDGEGVFVDDEDEVDDEGDWDEEDELDEDGNRIKNRKPEVTSYLSCGCGCCSGYDQPGTIPHNCVRSTDELKQIIANDVRVSQAGYCQSAGCGMGVFYEICDRIR